ncbi:MAG: chemotaxis protein CheC [Oscillospiraceae bacterium]|nr:chemotaxis protein CheC [Oscillospiraceae bacterium]
MIKKYDELNSVHIDVLREIGSIGSGNAATSLASVIDRKIMISVPQVQILENNEAVKKLGGAEKIVSAVLVKCHGEIDGMLLYLQSLEFINVVLRNVLSSSVERYEQLNEMHFSALVEIGNIMISSYVNALSTLTGLTIKLTIPANTINMLGGIMNVPMTEYGYESDKIMIINGNIICDGQEIESNLLMVPDIASLNTIMKKLGVLGG